MEEKLVTLATHTNKKALILKDLLERHNIQVTIDTLDGKDPSEIATSVRVRVREADLSKALMLVESERLFSYDDENTYLVDDGHPRILVPVDFSDYSLNACRIAFGVAKEHNAKVKILNVFYNPYYPMALPLAETFYKTEEEDRKSRDILSRVQDQMKNLLSAIDKETAEGKIPSVNYSYSLREGTADEEIAEYCKSYKPHLIVMGTKGSDHNEVNALGSVTANVIDMTDIPVLTIPKYTEYTEAANMKHVVFCTNFSQRDLITFDLLINFINGKKRSPKITLLHFDQKRKERVLGEEKLAKIREYFDTRYPTFDISVKMINTEDMFESMSRFIEDEDVNLVAINSSRRNLFVRIFVPSVSRKILARSKAPMLVLRASK
ncbi:universal stress protein [Dysgonomonas massiliensis]|uniref:universal stress protein n=1 Tax=Dysgonomonas massiliensis TaxID=2040292 RepID=UPI000C766FF7|nr:universal stress protein [Dysgonomonas massiliensis]